MKTSGPREATLCQVDAMINYCGHYFGEQRKTKSCFIHGMGGQPKATYKKLAGMDGVLVRLSYTSLKSFYKIFSFIPSFSGVVQVVNPASIAPVIGEIGDSGLMGIYIFDSQRDKNFIEFLKTNPDVHSVDEWIKSVGEIVCYQLDSNNAGSSTGIFDWYALGNNVPTSIISDVEKKWHLS